MPRFKVPRSTRTMYGTVTPAVVVVIARSAGVVPGGYGLKQLLVGAGAGGLGSRSAVEQPPVVVREKSFYSGAVLHCASTAKGVKPPPVVPRVVPHAAVR